MFGLIFLLLLVVPVVELYVLFQVADSIGWLLSIGLLFAISVTGGALIKWQTTGAFARVTEKISRGEMPSNELIDGALMIFGGALLLTPGFFTDAVGFCMFIPPVRIVVRKMVLKRMRNRITTFGAAGGHMFFGATFGGRSNHSFIDVDEVVIDRIPNPGLPSYGSKQSEIDDEPRP